MPSQIRTYGLGTLWYGAWATVAATFVGHYPVGATLAICRSADGSRL
jgi:hypothetical protein